MSRYLYNAAYYWEVVVDKRDPQAGPSVYLEERSNGKRRFLKTLDNPKELDSLCRSIQTDLLLSEEEFEAKYGVQLTSHALADSEPQSGEPQPV